MKRIPIHLTNIRYRSQDRIFDMDAEGFFLLYKKQKHYVQKGALSFCKAIKRIVKLHQKFSFFCGVKISMVGKDFIWKQM